MTITTKHLPQTLDLLAGLPGVVKKRNNISFALTRAPDFTLYRENILFYKGYSIAELKQDQVRKQEQIYTTYKSILKRLLKSNNEILFKDLDVYELFLILPNQLNFVKEILKRHRSILEQDYKIIVTDDDFEPEEWLVEEMDSFNKPEEV